MKRALLLVLVAGCDGNIRGTPIDAYHDDARGVTCWRTKLASGIAEAVALSCLPDSQLRDGGRP